VVEFGSIRVHLSQLPASLRPAVWAGEKPFATLLLQHVPQPIQQIIRPQAFFALPWDEQLQTLFAAPVVDCAPPSTFAADAIASPAISPPASVATANGSPSTGPSEPGDCPSPRAPPTVYGRCTWIFTGDERLICEVVEIMPHIPDE